MMMMMIDDDDDDDDDDDGDGDGDGDDDDVMMNALQGDVGQRHVAASKGTSKKPKTASSSSADFETTFDVDGHVETVAGQPPFDNQSALISLIVF